MCFPYSRFGMQHFHSTPDPVAVSEEKTVDKRFLRSAEVNKEQAETEACEGESGDYIYEPSENLGSSHARK